MNFAEVVEIVGKTVDGFGVVVIVVGALLATLRYAAAMRASSPADDAYRSYRRFLGRAVLLGLEFLLAGDIIRTVALDPTFRSLGVLAGIVAIRTFLSLELELEISGRWPWERDEAPPREGRRAGARSAEQRSG